MERTHTNEELTFPDLRLRCGYDLTANVSGVCPECGRLR